MTGDYYEGLEEGIAIGRREALEAAAAAASRPAGNNRMDFIDRQAIIVRRVRSVTFHAPVPENRSSEGGTHG